MKMHFLQTPTWEKYEKYDGSQTFRVQGDNFSCLAILKATPVGNYLFCPYGPTLAPADDPLILKAHLQDALTALTSLALSQKAFFIRVEPTFPLQESTSCSSTSCPFVALSVADLKSLHLVKSHDLDPAHTWALDLTQSESQIFANMEKEKGRLWRNHRKKSLSIRTTKNPSDICILSHLLEQVSAHNHFTPQNEAHLKRQLQSGFATLYIVELQGQPIAAALAHDSEDTRFYMHAAADFEHRKLAAGSILLVQMIIDAKTQGLKTFDFWGITTSTSPSHPWYGFTQFKKSFGGYQIDYAGTWDLPIESIRYALYGVLRRFNRLRRKVR